MGFVHLHNHTEYSLLDGAARVKGLVARAAELGQKGVAITDHGAMFGVIDFYKEAKKKGIKPIIGCEVYMAPRSMREKEGKQDKDYAHLVLLCQNNEGYQNLIRLVSLGYTEGFYYKPRIDYDLLSRHSEGLICLSACIAGDIPSLILENRQEEAKSLALRLKEMFPGRFYLELQDHGIPEQRTLNPQLMQMAGELDIPLVATNDVHYINKEDAEAQDVLLCIQTGRLVADADRMRFPAPEFYLKSEQEMQSLFSHVPAALENTEKICDMCEVSFTFGQIKLPKYQVPGGKTAEEYMLEICKRGLKQKYGEVTPEIEARFRYEYDMIVKMGYVDYYLIVWDYTYYAKTHDIIVGPGRGSGAGSLAAYAMDITTVDPMKYNLLFERFLNPERVSMPDFDVDFDPEGRGRVIEYVTEKYGQDCVAQIITFGTMGARAVVRDVGRVLSIPYQDCDRIAKMVPSELGITIEEALRKNPQLAALAATDEAVGKLMALSQKLEGMPRHSSTHAAGVVISKNPVDEYVPLALNDNAVVTQFTMKTLEDLGLLKMDFLGLRTLAVVRDTVEIVRRQTGTAPDVYGMSFDDPAVYELLARGETDGVFQLESAGMRAFMQQLKPTSFEDIIAGISLYRPGPMDSIPRYVQGKRNPEGVHYLHPLLKPVLEVTYGCMVYQEQVMQIARDVAGFSLGRSDILRRAMGKKDKAAMERERQAFIYGLKEENGQVIVPGALSRGVPEEVAVEIYEQMRTFAEYAFNKSHAAAYGVIAYQTAYLKHYYPAPFMAAMLNSFLGDLSKAGQYIQYCRDNGIAVLPPDINRSDVRFTAGEEGIRFGLAGIKNVGREAVAAILREREKGEFASLADFIKRTVVTGCVNRKMVESFIKAGAMDGFPENRNTMLSGYETLADHLISEQKRAIEGQFSLFAEMVEEETAGESIPALPEYPAGILLSMEKEMLGVYLSGHPLEEYVTGTNDFSLARLAEEDIARLDGEDIALCGIVTELKQKTTRQNSLMAFITVEDKTASIECLVFPAIYTRFQPLLQKESAVRLTGSLSVREEEAPKLIVESVSRLQRKEGPAAPRGEKPAAAKEEICLRIEENEESLFAEVCVLAAQRPGGTPVRIFYTGLKTQALCPNKAEASEETLACFKRLLGDRNVAVRPKKGD